MKDRIPVTVIRLNEIEKKIKNVTSSHNHNVYLVGNDCDHVRYPSSPIFNFAIFFAPIISAQFLPIPAIFSEFLLYQFFQKVVFSKGGYVIIRVR
jgi:hypothetical protein